jgi:hypothetical protein
VNLRNTRNSLRAMPCQILYNTRLILHVIHDFQLPQAHRFSVKMIVKSGISEDA